MDNVWVYAGAGFVGFLWGAGNINGTVAVAFMAGLWMGNSNVIQWAVLALIAGYIIGNALLSRKGQATT
jgi:hypothetical protein